MFESDVDKIHTPIMPDEVIRLFKDAADGVIVDATLGLGGHSERLLSAFGSAIVVGIDQDPEAIARVEQRLRPFGKRMQIVNANFSKIKAVIRSLDLNEGPAAILADLGVSSLQLDDPSRGFSFRHEAPLDMRMNRNSAAITAEELLATATEEEIANIIYEFGEERASRKIARRIVSRRESGRPVRTTFDLAELVKGVVRVGPRERTHPATRTFQALRIAVNNELGILEEFIDDSIEILRPAGILAMITFHSLEDRIVKRAFQKAAGKCQCPPRIPMCVCGATEKGAVLTKKPILPTDEEKRQNSRSQSAKLRAFQKGN